EVAGDGRLAAAGRLEVDARRQSEWPRRSHGDAVHGDRIAARNAEGIDAAVILAFGADDRFELGGVEIDGRRRGSGGRGRARGRAGGRGGGGAGGGSWSARGGA